MMRGRSTPLVEEGELGLRRDGGVYSSQGKVPEEKAAQKGTSVDVLRDRLVRAVRPGKEPSQRMKGNSAQNSHRARNSA